VCVLRCDDVDAVTVSVSTNGGPCEIGVYCGNKRPPMLMSHDNNMDVVFVSKGQSKSRGFQANYSFVTG